MESGTLADHPPSELLRGLASLGATGCLRLVHEGTTATVHFRDGTVYTASAPEARARLGDRLVGAGHITDDQLAATLSLQRSLATPRRIGELLIERGLIDRETMRTYVREQIADSVAASLRWTEGEWSFSDGEEVPEDAPLDTSTENLLMEGARRLEQWDLIEARLGSVDTVVDFSPEGSAAELSLTPDEWAMLTRIDGASTIAEIADEAGYGQFEAARIIYGLLTAGVVTVVGDDEGDLTGDEAEAVGEGAGAEAGGDLGEGSGAPGEGGPEAEPEIVQAWDPSDWDPAEGVPVVPPAATDPPHGEQGRNELLREFAALDEEFDDAPPPPPPPRPARPVEPPRSPSEERRDRRGIFRRRRD